MSRFEVINKVTFISDELFVSFQFLFHLEPQVGGSQMDILHEVKYHSVDHLRQTVIVHRLVKQY